MLRESSNLIRALVTLAPETVAATESGDNAIREDVLAAVQGLPWALARENVTVENGTLHLWGPLIGSDEGNAIRVAAESAPGVKDVRTHFGRPPIDRAPG
ncbi:hypothetical protein [Paraburkholderia youngii]|uniref:hypothetical protein n=1 Tax=Paraburkholderia youngii TaxID=2782701 RepID=UPI003D256C79